MKKITLNLFFICLSVSGFSQSYQTALKKLNDFLKTFDNGYYGYMEIKDGYLYDRFKSGKYCKVLIKDIGKASTEEESRKVVLNCKSGSCVFSTYTDSYHEKLSFSQSDNFNTKALVKLLDDLTAALNNTSSNNTTSSGDWDKYKSNIDILSSGSTSGSKSSVNDQTALQKLNTFLKTFDNGYYGYMEIKDGYLYDRFPSGKYTKTLMTDLSRAEEETYKKKVRIKCKYDADCVFSTYTDSYHKQLSFSQTTDFNTAELITLLNNLIDSYNNKVPEEQVSTSSSSTKPVNLQTALAELNAYMKTFDNNRYQGMEVKDGYVYNYYANSEYSKAKVEDMDYVKMMDGYIKLGCKNGNACVYSTITKSYHEYFNFQTSTGKSLDKMKTLLDNFLAALKGKNTGNSSNTTQTEAQKLRQQKDKERQTQTSTSSSSSNAMLDYINDIFGETETTKTNINPASYSKQLKALNDYLKTFNSATYGDVEVKNNDVIFNFKFSSQKFSSSISITELIQNTTVIKGKSAGTFGTDEIKILCKNDSKCFYSTYSKSTADHFRFYSNTVKDLTKIEQLVKDFIQSLK